MDSTLSFLLQKNSCQKILLAGIVVAFKNMYFSGCCLLYALRRMINGCDVTK